MRGNSTRDGKVITRPQNVDVCALSNFLDVTSVYAYYFAMKLHVQPCEGTVHMRNLEARCVPQARQRGIPAICVVLRHGVRDQECDERIVHAPFYVSDSK